MIGKSAKQIKSGSSSQLSMAFQCKVASIDQHSLLRFSSSSFLHLHHHRRYCCCCYYNQSSFQCFRTDLSVCMCFHCALCALSPPQYLYLYLLFCFCSVVVRSGKRQTEIDEGADESADQATIDKTFWLAQFKFFFLIIISVPLIKC